MHFFLHDIWHPLHGDGYQFWSGLAGDLGIFVGVFVFYTKHNCHVRRCWRIQFRPHPDDPHHIVCKKHS